MKKPIKILAVLLLLLSKTAVCQGPVVVYPNGGETLTAGTTINITWSGVPNGEIVGIDYTIDNWANTIWLTTSYASTGSYAWLVPNTVSTQCKVGVFNSSFAGDISDNFFSITKATALAENEQSPFLTYPNPIDDARLLTVESSEQLRFQLFDGTGQLKEVPVQQESNRYRLNLNDVSTGIYFLQVFVSGAEKSYTKKLLIQ
jgi:hypothetical protein